ncbi:ABC1-domain-containing protein [Vararia minispora EC-137]|uniref:ABC1-domain-containing protein n=1 Tax=Vararia minispora EC-137 TaxID=1314806 RepID=A0ACB8QW81_9AGAM|nr:ABC1-domain-containing protein [Vararia minispora EC-137]
MSPLTTAPLSAPVPPMPFLPRFAPRFNGHRTTARRKHKTPAVAFGLVLSAGAGWIAYENLQDFRHLMMAGMRCARVAEAAVLDIVDYKWTLMRSYLSEDACAQAVSECHERSARRVLRALLANGGVFIKLGQHISSLIVLPVEWTSTMRPLQDQCEPTMYEALEPMVVHDTGRTIEELFSEFEREPIGVASLAQVHRARLRGTGKLVAVKLQHPHLDEFCEIDMKMVEVTLGWVKRWFPTFEFSWLGEEMRENLPKEMDFAHEASNAARCAASFAGIRTALHVPRVLSATKRVMVMEFIEGGRPDDLAYLAREGIDRNKVAVELSRIFARMVYLDGYFHADPHPGNLLIRPSPPGSRSPYNFEIALLDHGLYFDLDHTLRINYARLWLSLIAPATPENLKDRRKYAELVGNIGPDKYWIFETALTGRANMSDTAASPPSSTAHADISRASSLLEHGPISTAEIEAIRTAVTTREGLLFEVLEMLRGVPRRVLMVFKLNDLTRGLNHALCTTHEDVRVFLIVAAFCAHAVVVDEVSSTLQLLTQRRVGAWSAVKSVLGSVWRYERLVVPLGIYEAYLDAQAWARKVKLWLIGLRKGFKGASLAAAGLDA